MNNESGAGDNSTSKKAAEGPSEMDDDTPPSRLSVGAMQGRIMPSVGFSGTTRASGSVTTPKVLKVKAPAIRKSSL